MEKKEGNWSLSVDPYILSFDQKNSAYKNKNLFIEVQNFEQKSRDQQTSF